MATVLGQVNLNGCNYQLAYDLLGQDTVNNLSTVRFYGILNVTNNFVSWTRGSASVHTSGLAAIGTYYSKGSHTVITRDFNLGHDANGDFSVYIGASLSTTFTSGDCGGVLTLPRISRQALVTSATDFNDEQNPVITYTNPGNFRINARLEFGGVSIQRDNIPNTGSYTFNLTDEERDLLRSKCPNSNNLSVREIIATCIGGSNETHWAWLDRTMTIVNANPTFTNFTFKDINPKTVALTGNNLSFITGYSNAEITISQANVAVAKKKATMSKYRVVISDKTVDIPFNSENTATGLLEKVTGGVINTYAIDSRSNSTLVTKQAVNIIEYNDLIKENISASRNNNNIGEVVTLNFEGTMSVVNFGLKSNSIKKATYTIKRTDGEEIVTGQTNIMPVVNENKFSFSGVIRGDVDDYGFDANSSYEIKVFVEDELSQIEYNFILGSGRPNIALHKDGVSVMGAYNPELGGSLQIAGKRFDDYFTFSEEEKVIGKWIDGRSVYRKVLFDSGGNSGSTDNVVAHGISNLDRIIISYVNSIDKQHTDINRQYTTTRISNDGALSGITYIDNTNLYYEVCERFGTRIQDLIIILIYIKKSD